MIQSTSSGKRGERMAMIQMASNEFPRQVQIRRDGEEQIEVIETSVRHAFNTIARGFASGEESSSTLRRYACRLIRYIHLFGV